MEPILTDALDETGKIVNIHDVERGLACKCYCPKCSEPLVAKLGNKDGRQAHFAHYQEGNCHGAQMAAIHRRAIEIIAENKTVMAPQYKTIKAKVLIFDEVEIEQRVERKDLQPDIVGITSEGQRYNIEIRYTHEVDEEKRKKMIASGMTCLEIDVRELNMGNLTTFLLKTKDKREWINNPIYDQNIQEDIQKRLHIFNISPSNPLKRKEKNNDTHFIEEKLKEL